MSRHEVLGGLNAMMCPTPSAQGQAHSTGAGAVCVAWEQMRYSQDLSLMPEQQEWQPHQRIPTTILPQPAPHPTQPTQYVCSAFAHSLQMPFSRNSRPVCEAFPYPDCHQTWACKREGSPDPQLIRRGISGPSALSLQKRAANIDS